MKLLQKGVKTPNILFYTINPALQDVVSNLKIRTLTPTFMLGREKQKKMGFIPTCSTPSGLI